MINIHVDWKDIVISSGAIVGAMWVGIRYYVKKMVDQRFQKNIEDHKHELQLLMEQNKFDLQRRVQDFSLFTTKKHAVYAELYDLYLRADGYVTHLLTQPDIILKNIRDEEELIYALSESNFPQFLINRFVDEWDKKPREELRNELIKEFENIDIENTRKAIRKARDTFLINRIYLSNETLELMGELNKFYSKIITSYILFSAQPLNYKDLIEEGKSHIKKLTEVMRDELAIGYYDNISIKPRKNYEKNKKTL